ncbi:MAG: ATP-binding protein [Burkholderiales bacterium]
MRTLTLRIYLTVVAVLLLFAFASSVLFQRHVASERAQVRLQEQARAESANTERLNAWADLIQRSLPGADAPTSEQAQAVREWSERLRIPLALHNPAGERIWASDAYLHREQNRQTKGLPLRLDDGRTLWIMRGMPLQGAGQGHAIAARAASVAQSEAMGMPPRSPPFMGWPRGVGLAVLLVLLFVAIAAAAWPVARALTKRLNLLKAGVEKFGAGALNHRVEVSGKDEVAAVAASFNQAAQRIETLVQSHQTLLANASHELRSPLARLKMALSLLEGSEGPQRERLKQEIRTNIGELDALVEEVLLASRLDAQATGDAQEPIDLLGLAAEEAARVDAEVHGNPVTVHGDERLLRRALRNLLENAHRYGQSASSTDTLGSAISVDLRQTGEMVALRVCDRGPGVPAAHRERIFEPFFRLPGHAEKAGGVGLGLSLVKQIAKQHGGRVVCEAREGGGSCFVLALPMNKTS